jgi:hypothetical protein
LNALAPVGDNLLVPRLRKERQDGSQRTIITIPPPEKGDPEKHSHEQFSAQIDVILNFGDDKRISADWNICEKKDPPNREKGGQGEE